MKLKNQNILFFTRTMKLGGTENIILQMCEVLKPYVNSIVVCSCGGINEKKLEAMGIKHYTIPDIENKNILLICEVFRKIYDIITQENINIVHTHHRMATFYMHFIYKRCKVILISTLHGTFTDKKMLTRFIYRNIDIIACGKTVKESFANNYGISEKQITVINNAIKKNTDEIVRVDEINNLPDNCKKIGYIGRLSAEKGIDILIETISLVVKDRKDVYFIVAGTGDLEESFLKKIHEEGLDNRVVFLGYRNDAQNIIKQIDATILTSYTEGLPLTPIESFAHGKPIIATNAGGTSEIVEDGDNGYLVQIGDSRALANKILDIFDNQDKYEQISKSALRTFQNKYDYDTFKNKIIKFYNAICKDGK